MYVHTSTHTFSRKKGEERVLFLTRLFFEENPTGFFKQLNGHSEAKIKGTYAAYITYPHSVKEQKSKFFIIS